jgi:hypothetical protein
VRTNGLIFLAFLALAGCGIGTHGDLPPGGIAALDGTYRGDASLSLGRTSCPGDVPYVITVRNGMAYGEIYRPRDPKVITGRFEALIDAEGKIGTKAWIGGDETLVEGFFDRDRFLGSTKSDSCTNQMTLRRVRS